MARARLDTRTRLSSLPRGGPKRLNRRNEVVRAGKRPRVPRERIASATVQADHALEHRGEGALVGAEADEHRPMVGHRSVRYVATEDVAEPFLICTRHSSALALSRREVSTIGE